MLLYVKCICSLYNFFIFLPAASATGDRNQALLQSAVKFSRDIAVKKGGESETPQDIS